MMMDNAMLTDGSCSERNTKIFVDFFGILL